MHECVQSIILLHVRALPSVVVYVFDSCPLFFYCLTNNVILKEKSDKSLRSRLSVGECLLERHPANFQRWLPQLCRVFVVKRGGVGSGTDWVSILRLFVTAGLQCCQQWQLRPWLARESPVQDTKKMRYYSLRIPIWNQETSRRH